MKTKKSILGLAILGVAVTGATFAYQGNPGVKNPDCQDPVKHEAMTKAFESKNFEAWKELTAEKGVSRKIDNQEKFAKFVALREAAIKGDTATVQKLSEELNLGQKRMDGNGMKGNMKKDGSGVKRGMGQKLAQ